MSNDSTIRKLPTSNRPAEVELAGGLALLAGLEHTHAPALRWYGMEPPALIAGSSQRLDEIDTAACAAAGLAIHRRRSGGGAVLSESMLMLDLALPRDHWLATDDVTESYRWLGLVWVAALNELGVDARAIPVDEARADTKALEPLLRRVCFGGVSPYEVMIGSRKLVGLSQVRRRGGALLQAGLYMRWRPARTAVLIAGAPLERAALAGRLVERVAGLAEFCGGQPPDAAHVIAAFEQALARQTGLISIEDDWNAQELAARDTDLPRYAPIEAG
jgi:lipoate-protein ligase A